MNTEADGPGARLPGSPGHARGRILVVEDDAVAASYVLHVLRRRAGFTVSHAVHPAAALDRVRGENWDLVITDVEMPGMSGIELLEHVREISPQLPVAVLTAHPSLDYAVRALRNSADEFLEKPIAPDRLVDVVAGLVAKGRAAREATRQSVLAIGAHPDDVEIGTAGTLLAHRQMGHDVAILTLSRGARGGQEDTRSDEAQKAAEIIGATLYHENLRDTSISEADPTIGVISRVVAEVRPTVIYTHSLHDVHQDHRNTHRAALVAVRGVGRVYCFQSPSATVDFRPTRFVPIDGQLGEKLRAIDAFGSQVEIRAYLEPDLISATARYWSRYCGARYAEPFEVVRESAVAGQHEFRAADAGVGSGHAVAAPPARRPAQPVPLATTAQEVPDAAG
ncbi:MAG TPA: response regulator [Streptosporangiaceae bacterium]|nr:response regulator [Streptosporangiaceae bacterium]